MKTEIKTSNLIIKTLIVLVILSLFVTAVFMVFFPGVVAGIADDMGMTKASIAFEKVNYDKTDDINSLATILNYEIFTEDYQEIVEYGSIMINHKYFSEYVAFLGVNSLTNIDYKTYVETYLMQACYKESEEDATIAILSNALTTGYESYGSGILLASEVASAEDAEFAGDMLAIYESNFNGASDMKQYNIILEAMLISDTAGGDTSVWEERLATLNDKFA